MKHVMNSIRDAWTAGKKLTINESMIRYMGKAISFVQYMPLKPINHGIKVFAVCCLYTGYLLGYKVYLGKDYQRDGGSAIQVVDRLITNAGFTQHRGRIFDTYNWYNSVPLAKHLFENYGWTIIGTVSPTDKLARSN